MEAEDVEVPEAVGLAATTGGTVTASSGGIDGGNESFNIAISSQLTDVTLF